jgi:hypothetical protein
VRLSLQSPHSLHLLLLLLLLLLAFAESVEL